MVGSCVGPLLASFRAADHAWQHRGVVSELRASGATKRAVLVNVAAGRLDYLLTSPSQISARAMPGGRGVTPVLLSLLVLFAAFFCCSLVQQYLLLQLRRYLATRHHKEWCEISEAVFVRRATIRFALDKRDELLHDPELTTSPDASG